MKYCYFAEKTRSGGYFDLFREAKGVCERLDQGTGEWVDDLEALEAQHGRTFTTLVEDEDALAAERYVREVGPLPLDDSFLNWAKDHS